MNNYNNKWFPFFNIMIAKEKLKKHRVYGDHAEVLMGLLIPNTPAIHQFLLTNTATDKAIAVQQVKEANLNKANAEMLLTNLVSAVKDLKPDGTDLKAKVTELKKKITDLFPEEAMNN